MPHPPVVDEVIICCFSTVPAFLFHFKSLCCFQLFDVLLAGVSSSAATVVASGLQRGTEVAEWRLGA